MGRTVHIQRTHTLYSRTSCACRHNTYNYCHRSRAVYYVRRPFRPRPGDTRLVCPRRLASTEWSRAQPVGER